MTHKDLISYLNENEIYYTSIEQYIYLVKGMAEEGCNFIDNEPEQLESFASFLSDLANKLRTVKND